MIIHNNLYKTQNQTISLNYPSMSTLCKRNMENHSKTGEEAECIPSKMSTQNLEDQLQRSCHQ